MDLLREQKSISNFIEKINVSFFVKFSKSNFEKSFVGFFLFFKRVLSIRKSFCLSFPVKCENSIIFFIRSRFEKGKWIHIFFLSVMLMIVVEVSNITCFKTCNFYQIGIIFRIYPVIQILDQLRLPTHLISFIQKLPVEVIHGNSFQLWKYSKYHV